MRAVAKEASVRKVIINGNAEWVDGTYNALKNTIYIQAKQNKKNLLITFFHEMGHHTAVKNKQWLPYHRGSKKDITAEDAFMIENAVDKIAASLWRKYVDPKVWGRYTFCYPASRKRSLIKWLKQYYEIS